MRIEIRAVLVAVMLLLAAVVPATPGMGSHVAPQTEGAPGPARDTSGQPAAEPAPALPKDPVAQCLQDSLNNARVARGLPPLPETPSLLALAQSHSDVMASQQFIHHSTDAVLALLPAGWRAYGENVVYGTSCEQMFQAFMDSESHRDAMLRPDFNLSGTAVSYGSNGWIYATLVFLTLPPPPAPPNPVPAPPVVPVPAPAVPSVPAAPPAQPEPLPQAAPEAPAPPTISLGPLPSGSVLFRAAPGAIEPAGRSEGISQLSRSEKSQGEGPRAGTPAVEGRFEEGAVHVFELERGVSEPRPSAKMIIDLEPATDQQPDPQPSGMS